MENIFPADYEKSYSRHNNHGVFTVEDHGSACVDTGPVFTLNSSVYKKNNKRKIALLGATGSVGGSTLKVIREHCDELELIGIAAGSRGEALDTIAREFNVRNTALFSRDGFEGLERLATLPEADIVLVATTGTVALRAVLAALAAGKDVALANKETMVVGGHLVKAAERLSPGRVYPIDSEHNAIFQCLEGNRAHGNVQRLLLTASGGAFRDIPAEKLQDVTVEDALRHPNWSMGPKITVDCATMANKGLEIIEACRLFDMSPDQIEVVIHPQSIVHSMVEFCDNTILAQMSLPSMTFAIQHILLYPERKPGVYEAIDFTKALSLDFSPPDMDRYPCLRLAREALITGEAFPMVYNTSNEAAVNAFLNRKLPFSAIPGIIEDTLESFTGELPNNVEDLFEAEKEVYVKVKSIICNYT